MLISAQVNSVKQTYILRTRKTTSSPHPRHSHPFHSSLLFSRLPLLLLLLVNRMITFQEDPAYQPQAKGHLSFTTYTRGLLNNLREDSKSPCRSCLLPTGNHQWHPMIIRDNLSPFMFPMAAKVMAETLS